MSNAEITVEMLADAVGLGRVPDQEVVGILHGLLPLSRLDPGESVAYFHPDLGHVLDVQYDNGEIVRVEPREGLTREFLETLRSTVGEAFAEDAAIEVRRGVMFSGREIRGHWRHADDWQILPVPSHAPRVEAVFGKHPFIIEYSMRSSPKPAVLMTRASSRYWELHVLLSLLVHGGILPESSASESYWVVLEENGGWYSAYANEGYMVGGDGFIVRAAEFSDPVDHPKLNVVGDDEYYARDRIAPDAADLPSCIDQFFDRFEAADVPTRERLLRAAYWFDMSYRAWNLSKSVSLVASVNSIEALLGEGEMHTCTECGQPHRYPGPTRLFREFVEQYAASEDVSDRRAIYNLRSTFVHGGGLHALDVPRGWGMNPTDEAQRNLHEASMRIARTAIRTWFMRL